MKDQKKRRELAREKRLEAAQIAYHRGYLHHEHNEDEYKFQHPHGMKSFLMSYTKGLCHDEITGLVKDPVHYLSFVRGIESGDPWDFENTPLGPVCDYSYGKLVPKWLSHKALKGGPDGKRVHVRAWESAGAGLTFDNQGPDAQAVTMPPAPKLGSDELTAEIAEVYAQAILRDVPLTAFYPTISNSNAESIDIVNELNDLPWFAEKRRTGGRPLEIGSIFRGVTNGDHVGPYLSQFLLAGDTGLGGGDKGGNEFYPSDGRVNFGAYSFEHKVRTAIPKLDYMKTWEEWLDVQNGADLRGLESYIPEYDNDTRPTRRFITTGRDLATYVHYDALYQAYLNACLLLLSLGAPFDPGIPFQRKDEIDHQQGFAHYGGPHILTLVTEVATRALKAVRYQKFNVHRRIRPEVLAARLEKKEELKHIAPELKEVFHALGDKFTSRVKSSSSEGNMLLPMAFCEGSPMHPSYGAGHATVAGACVTILKAFFDTNKYLKISSNGKKFSIADEPGRYAFVPKDDGTTLKAVHSDALTVGGELNKLAANISIGRNWGGVHYFSDYEQSIYMGEEIALAMLQEQSILYNPLEGATMSVEKFNGEVVTIKDGEIFNYNSNGQPLVKGKGIVKVNVPIA